MRLLVLAHNLHSGGGRTVGSNLVRAVSEVFVGDSLLSIVPHGDDYQVTRGQVERAMVTGLRSRVTYDLFNLPRIVSLFKPDWVLGLGNYCVAPGPYQQGLLVHDPYLLTGTSLWELCRGAPRRFYLNKRLLRTRFLRYLPAIDVIFCQTEHARAQLLGTKLVQEPPVVVPNVVPESLRTPKDRRANGTDDYFRLLTPSRYYPHKNLEGVAEAFETFPDLLKGVHWTITIDRRDGPGARRLLNRIGKGSLGSVVSSVGYVNQARLADLYANSDAMILPSTLESFSGAYCEAMAFGLPIITSDRGFATEVCDRAAIYFEPTDVSSIASAIDRVRSNPDLRRTLITEGTTRLEEFPSSWTVVASRILSTLGASEIGDPT